MSRKRRLDHVQPKWRMPTPCDDCPFSDSPAGTHMRESLNANYFSSVCTNLLRGGHFVCHKSVDYEKRNRATEKICAGSIEWQAKRKIVADLVQVMERLSEIIKS